MPSRELTITRVYNGSFEGMPPFRNAMTQEQVAAVAEFVRANAGK